MKIRPLLRAIVGTIFVCATASILHATSSSSANYSIVADSLDSGGTQISSANYTSQGGLGGVGGISRVTTPSETLKSGYAGQLYQVTGLELASTFDDNGATQQLDAAQTLDDGTLLALIGGNETWTVTAGQLPAGLTLNPSTGVISGTPSGTGAYSFTIQVSDGLGDTTQQTFSGMGSTPASDTPTMPPCALGLLGLLLYAFAGRHLTKSVRTIGYRLARRMSISAAT